MHFAMILMVLASDEQLYVSQVKLQNIVRLVHTESNLHMYICVKKLDVRLNVRSHNSHPVYTTHHRMKLNRKAIVRNNNKRLQTLADLTSHVNL